MKDIAWLAVALLLAAGCVPKTETDDDPLKGRPISDWIADARAEAPREDRETIRRALTHALDEAEDDLLVEVADALGVFGADARPAAPALAALLGHEHPWVRVAAMETLGGMKAAPVPRPAPRRPER